MNKLQGVLKETIGEVVQNKLVDALTQLLPLTTVIDNPRVEALLFCAIAEILPDAIIPQSMVERLKEQGLSVKNRVLPDDEAIAEMRASIAVHNPEKLVAYDAKIAEIDAARPRVLTEMSPLSNTKH